MESSECFSATLSRTRPRPRRSPWPRRPRSTRQAAEPSNSPTSGCGSASSASAAGPRRISIRPSSCRTNGKVEIAAVCDVFNRYRDEAAQKVNRGTKHKPEANRRLPRHPQRQVDRRRVHRHARPLARQANDRRAQGRQARVLRKADDAQRRRSARRLQGVEGIGPRDASRRAVDLAARVEGRQQAHLRRPARQGADVPDLVLPQLRRGPVALLRARPRT